MLEKEWITNDKGQIVAIWVEHDCASPVKCNFTGVATSDGTESLNLPVDPLRDNSRIHTAFQELQAMRGSARQFMPANPPKRGNWSKFYTILKSVLP